MRNDVLSEISHVTWEGNEGWQVGVVVKSMASFECQHCPRGSPGGPVSGPHECLGVLQTQLSGPEDHDFSCLSLDFLVAKE